MEKTGTFLVTKADEGTAVLSDVEDGQVHPLAENPGVGEGDVIEATIAADPPLELAWRVESMEPRPVTVEAVPEPPGERALDAAPGEVGELARRSVEGGELHVVRVGADVEQAVEDVVADRATRARAARLGARRVEVRGGDGVVSVRYLKYTAGQRQ